MNKILMIPFDLTIPRWWNGIDERVKRAFFILLAINVFAFGFEMTNLNLHHDDVSHIFIEDTILGYYLGRFTFGFLHYYTQNAYIAPFLQIGEGIFLMTIYGIVISRFWGGRQTREMVIPAAIMCVFPYMAQLYQYNACAAPFALAHLFVALAIVVSTRGTGLTLLGAIALHVLANSIYQGVLANGVTILAIWVLSRVLVARDAPPTALTSLLKPIGSALLAIAVGGAIYLVIVSSMDLKFDSYQSAGKAFEVKKHFDIKRIGEAVFHGSRAFYFWPENYFPGYLKKSQLLLLLCAAGVTLWLPRTATAKLAALGIFLLALISPRVLQILHPDGDFHALTLTSYAVVIAGAVLLVHRTKLALAQNLSALAAAFVIAAYILQANWISTVSHLNTTAHFSTLTQILAALRSQSDRNWDGKTIAVIGEYDMKDSYPFKPATGVAVKFMRAQHMDRMAKLLRDESTFVSADATMPGVMEFAATHPKWPHPASVGVVNGIGVVVLSKK